MNPWLGFGLLALSLVSSVVFAKLHIDGGAYASTVLGLGVAVIQASSHTTALAKAAAPPAPAASANTVPPTGPTGNA